MKTLGKVPNHVTLLAALSAAAGAWLLRPKAPREPGVTVITGGSRGLGLALAHRFGRAGDRLVLCARSSQELEEAQRLLLERGSVQNAGDVLLITADLQVQAQAAGVVEQAFARFGRIDTLINNAGIIEVGPIESQTAAAFHRAMDTNFYAALHTVLAALPRLLTQSRANGRRASIVNISSIGGKIPVPHLMPYVASKFALTGFSETLHAELRLKGIRVTTVCPGLMRTGSHIQAEFTGQAQKEFQWFALGASTPVVAASAEHAAHRIFNAARAGSAEITITPQAWLAARAHGLAPSATQLVGALANQYILPAASEHTNSPTRGADLKSDPAPTALERRHNQA